MLTASQRSDPFTVSLVHLVDIASHPDVLPIRAASANGNRPFGKHAQTIADGHLDNAFCTLIVAVLTIVLTILAGIPSTSIAFHMDS